MKASNLNLPGYGKALGVGVSLLVLAPSFSFAKDTVTSNGTVIEDRSVAGVPEVLSKVHVINQSEIELGNLAIQKANDKAVVRYGHMLVKDHTRAEDDAVKLASEENIPLDRNSDEAMREENKTLFQNLKKLDGHEFDVEFIDAMVDGHAKAIELVKAVKVDSQDENAQKFFSKLLPNLEKHENQALKLQKKLARQIS